MKKYRTILCTSKRKRKALAKRYQTSRNSIKKDDSSLYKSYKYQSFNHTLICCQRPISLQHALKLLLGCPHGATHKGELQVLFWVLDSMDPLDVLFLKDSACAYYVYGIYFAFVGSGHFSNHPSHCPTKSGVSILLIHIVNPSPWSVLECDSEYFDWVGSRFPDFLGG